MRRILCMMLALMLGVSAAAEAGVGPVRHISVAACMAAADDMADKAGGSLGWRSEPYPGGYVLWGWDVTNVYLLADGDTLVMLGASVGWDAAERAPVKDFLGLSFVALGAVMMADGRGEEAAFEALLPMVNEQGFVQGVTGVAEDGEPYRFTLEGLDGAVLRMEEEQGLRLCLFLYAAPDLMPGAE